MRGMTPATIPFDPGRNTQEIVAKRLDELSVETHRLERVLRQKMIALAELKQSLLQKAFSGELTAGKAPSDAIRKAEEVA